MTPLGVHSHFMIHLLWTSFNLCPVPEKQKVVSLQKYPFPKIVYLLINITWLIFRFSYRERKKNIFNPLEKQQQV